MNKVLLGDCYAQSSREQVIEAKWDSLLKKLDTGRGSLSRYHDLMAVFADMDDCLADMAQIEVDFTPSAQLVQLLRHFIYEAVDIEGKYGLVLSIRRTLALLFMDVAAIPC